MKLILLLLLFVSIFSITFQTQTQTSSLLETQTNTQTEVTKFSTQFLTDCDSDTSCVVCQKTVYDLKFNYKTTCEQSHCKSTCAKVYQQWGEPNSVFKVFFYFVLHFFSV